MALLYHLRIALVGFFMGAADLIPGVSGGTIAFVCGIYERLLNGIKSFDLTALRMALRLDGRGLWAKIPFWFFLALGSGLLIAIFSLSKVLSGLFLTHPIELWSFFFGLVLGSIVLLARETWRWRGIEWVAFIVATLATYWLVGLETLHTPPTKFFLFIAGAIAICAMILPGISGSYLLVIMGKYQLVLEAVSTRDFGTLAIFVSGIVVGILSFVRVVSWLLRTYTRTTLIALTGIMAGALRTVWPWKETLTWRTNSKGVDVPLLQVNILPPENGHVLLAVVMLVAGMIAVIGMSRLGRTGEAAKHKA